MGKLLVSGRVSLKTQQSFVAKKHTVWVQVVHIVGCGDAERSMDFEVAQGGTGEDEGSGNQWLTCSQWRTKLTTFGGVTSTFKGVPSLNPKGW